MGMFGFDWYHALLAGVGAAIIVSYWLPRFVSGREPAASALLVLTGMGAFALPGMPAPPDPLTYPAAWEVVAELCVIIGLFGTGLRIDRLVGYARWRPTLRLLALAMPLTVGALALFGWAFAGMTLAGALLLGAVLSPTDPVLAGDVAVGPPQEGGEHPVRYALTTEAGLNDGLAFPFVHLGILVAGAGALTIDLAGEWLLRDVLWRIGVGAVGGVAIGWLLGRIMFDWPRDNALARTQSGVIAFAGVLVAYGLTELAEGYGFIAAFVGGVVLRREETHDRFHKRLHDFSESLEHALTAVLLVALGAALPSLWPYLDWQHALIALALVFAIRPLTAWASLAGSGLAGRERMVVAFYGVRGIGSVYYLAYATHIDRAGRRLSALRERRARGLWADLHRGAA
ncbi:cation:proton antiporter [Leptolyngbya sp. 15MV]|nr:cation:proton antiporter [Leptolyngbya sp. 15MV]